jgi:hypothetical protein
MPCRLDQRTRMYCGCDYLNYQGSDLANTFCDAGYYT